MMKKIALLALAAPLALAACGASSNSAQVDPVAYVKHAAQKTAALPSEHMAMNATLSVAGQSVTIKGGGDFSNSPPKGTLDMAISVLGRTISFKEVLDGPTGYLSSPLFGTVLPAGKTWMKLNLAAFEKSQGVSYSSLASQTPAQTLQQLEAAGTVKQLGTETIDGSETTEFEIDHLDLSKIPNGKLLSKLAHPNYGPIDVWIGNADGHVYRETFSFTYSVAGQNASGTGKIDFSKFGEAVHTTLPPAGETYDGTKRALKGLGA
jgi:hypothetical protein